MVRKRRIIRWGAEWYSRNNRYGVYRHIMWKEPNVPAIFRTRKEAREWITAKYGYIRQRADLRNEPHGWRFPKAIRVIVDIKPAPSQESKP